MTELKNEQEEDHYSKVEVIWKLLQILPHKYSINLREKLHNSGSGSKIAVNKY